MLTRRLFLLGTAAMLCSPAARADISAGLTLQQPPVPVPSFDMKDGQSRPVTLESYRGRAVLLNLWASWCPPCVAELPTLDRLKPTAANEDIAVVALCLDRSGNVGAVNTYARLGIQNLDVIVDSHRAVAQMLNAAILPTTLMIDPQGREVARFVGAAHWDSPQAMALLRMVKMGAPLDAGMALPPIK